MDQAEGLHPRAVDDAAAFGQGYSRRRWWCVCRYQHLRDLLRLGPGFGIRALVSVDLPIPTAPPAGWFRRSGGPRGSTSSSADSSRISPAPRRSRGGRAGVSQPGGRSVLLRTISTLTCWLRRRTRSATQTHPKSSARWPPPSPPGWRWRRSASGARRPSGRAGWCARSACR